MSTETAKKKLKGYGKVICEKCGKIIVTCKCFKCDGNILYDICDECVEIEKDKYKYLYEFSLDDNSTWDELAKEIVKLAPNEVEDFIYCLVDNSSEDNKKDILNMFDRNRRINLSIKYRKHCGMLEESMKTVMQFNNFEDLKTYVKKQWSRYYNEDDIKIEIKYYTKEDSRIGWKDIQIVMVSTGGDAFVDGFCSIDYKNLTKDKK